MTYWYKIGHLMKQAKVHVGFYKFSFITTMYHILSESLTQILRSFKTALETP